MEERSCERYNIQKDKWEMSAGFDEFTQYVSIVVSKKRYLLVYGGVSMKGEYYNKETIRSFDHLKPQGGWRNLSLKDPLRSGGGYG